MQSVQLTTTTQAVDPVFLFIFGACLILLLAITGTMVYFAIRYHRSREPQPTSQVDGNLWLELVWTILPVILVLAMFFYGWSGYLSLRMVPPGAIPVQATARMWSWSFTYENGKKSPELYVPVGRPVLVNLVSLDVLHGFYIPAFRVKRDVVPGMKNHAWFVADRPGSYDLFCSQYCGTGHSGMITTVEALPEKEFIAWLNSVPRTAGGGKGEAGKKLAQEKGCLACHSTDGSPKVGPTLKGLNGRSVTVITGGKERVVVADDAYIRRSIVDPGADVVKGFPNIMPPFKDLSKEELESLEEYIEGLK